MDPHSVPVFRQVVLDCTDARALAEFYRELLGFRYRVGDEPPPEGDDDPPAPTGPTTEPTPAV